jgi:imidazoleglycerol-phosphate dehydratase
MGVCAGVTDNALRIEVEWTTEAPGSSWVAFGEGELTSILGDETATLDHRVVLYGLHADTEIDLHHTVEDVGLALGEALDEALGERRGVCRFAHAYAPLDEALARAVVDLSGRGFFSFSAPQEIERSWVTPEFPLTLLSDFFQALSNRARLTLHLHLLEARNPHHAAEAAFKAVALALRQAVAIRDGEEEVPSTKGTLSE